MARQGRQRDELRTVHNLGNSSTGSSGAPSPATDPSPSQISVYGQTIHKSVRLRATPLHTKADRESLRHCRSSGSKRETRRPFTEWSIRPRHRTRNSAVGR